MAAFCAKKGLETIPGRDPWAYGKEQAKTTKNTAKSTDEALRAEGGGCIWTSGYPPTEPTFYQWRNFGFTTTRGHWDIPGTTASFAMGSGALAVILLASTSFLRFFRMNEDESSGSLTQANLSNSTSLPRPAELFKRFQAHASKTKHFRAVPPPASLRREAIDALHESEGWKHVSSSDGVDISTRKVSGNHNKQIRGKGILKVPADSVLKLFRCSEPSKIREFNPMYADGCDVMKVDGHTKISWSKTHGVPFISPRDFVTFVQLLRTRKGEILILNQSTDHPSHPPGKGGCVRGKMLLGVNAVKPKGVQECEFTFVQQVDTGGALPAWLMNRLMVSDSVSFVKRIEKAAKNVPKKRGENDIDIHPITI
ncbi:hypothetical protein AAMO2058_000780000 [Amorphochlora amoebiformis]